MVKEAIKTWTLWRKSFFRSRKLGFLSSACQPFVSNLYVGEACIENIRHLPEKLETLVSNWVSCLKMEADLITNHNSATWMSHDWFQGVDPDYDQQLVSYFLPYHEMITSLCRLAVREDCLSDQLVSLVALTGCEAVPLHFTLFPQLWLDIYRQPVSSLLLQRMHCNFQTLDFPPRGFHLPLSSLAAAKLRLT